MMPVTPEILGTWSGAVVLLIALLVCGWALYARAVRVDRLHRQVLGARATLEAQLLHRAQAAAELADCGALDPASALLLSRAAHDALEAEGPIVSDGLDPAPRLDAPRPGMRERSVVESDLSRVLRTVLDEPTRAALAGPGAASALARLDRASYRLVLARRFHNTHVSQARALRAKATVRLFHLAGHAPMPATFEADDETRPFPESPRLPEDAASGDPQR
ncbi:MAG: hypothetical protein Q4E00_03525 [Actinomyces bowdenii]|nr:hypothetical protein [Actinomyces bowdenii]